MREDILVIHQGALGDVILSFPALVQLKQQRDIDLSILCANQIGRLAFELNVVERHFPVEKSRFCGLFSAGINRDMTAFINSYDTVIFIGFSDEIADNISKNHRGTTYKITPRPPAETQGHIGRHILRQFVFHGLLKDVGNICRKPGPVPSFPLGERNTDRLVKSPQQNSLVIIHPGAGSKRKRWPFKGFLEVAGALNKRDSIQVIFLVGPAEADLLMSIKKRASKGKLPLGQSVGLGNNLPQGNCTGHRRDYLYCHTQDLSEVLALMKASSFFIGNDSGLTHLAAYLGVATVAIFGPSSSKRWAPMGDSVKLLRGTQDCPPCFEVAKDNCDDPQCLSGVSADMVLDAVGGVW